MTKTQALVELQWCRYQAEACKEVHLGKRDAPVGEPSYTYYNYWKYYADKVNKLKQKYFFTEQI